MIRLTNFATRRKDAFEPLDADNVRMYVCGPTVYDRAHMGNARSAVVFDTLYRLLRHVYGEEAVTYVRNITDVDDKINARALRDYPDLPLNEAIARVTKKTADQFHADVKALGCLRWRLFAACRPKLTGPGSNGLLLTRRAVYQREPGITKRRTVTRELGFLHGVDAGPFGGDPLQRLRRIVGAMRHARVLAKVPQRERVALLTGRCRGATMQDRRMEHDQITRFHRKGDNRVVRSVSFYIGEPGQVARTVQRQRVIGGVEARPVVERAVV